MHTNTPFTNIVLCVHSPMHKAYLKVMEHICPNANSFMGYDVEADQDPSFLVDKIYKDIKFDIKEGNSVLILTDLIGATPYNISKEVVSKLQKDGVDADLISGINMGIVLTALGSQSLPFQELKLKIIESGRKCMKLASEDLKDTVN
ncbi:PTS sugar transporter subunit IIA [Taylorella equigenitalis]|uniref:PTS system IIa component n=2 Tax=Taylorella equigenitalis TaxID=29575 RepID=I7JNE7_9BURK|nr:PTS IIa component [Taylorella equigenitalis]ASY30790.1 PTS sugar transporter subunit IIA [Taylorella equigenitalis]ASY38092.1 PTS sugar transporter subunit IIA [Taylorella equigenitalis]ASY42508.1 PTS sugar transporter subunit IIA [Taylorella equigenitalis]KGK34080.1 PTS sugar transporter subunit IIA [Taylorella equigenitalis]KOS59409.1 PTS sugar transporter subunit IIA [Taylorella equigenitalis]